MKSRAGLRHQLDHRYWRQGLEAFSEIYLLAESLPGLAFRFFSVRWSCRACASLLPRMINVPFLP